MGARIDPHRCNHSCPRQIRNKREKKECVSSCRVSIIKSQELVARKDRRINKASTGQPKKKGRKDAPRNEERERANDARSAIQWNPYLRVPDFVYTLSTIYAPCLLMDSLLSYCPEGYVTLSNKKKKGGIHSVLYLFVKSIKRKSFFFSRARPLNIALQHEAIKDYGSAQCAWIRERQ